MLVPALLYKEELLKKFSAEMYSDRYFYYVGWRGEHTLPQIDDRSNHYIWAIVDQNDPIGYFAYAIDFDTSCAYNFGLYSFAEDQSIMRNASILGRDVFNKLEELVNSYHRVSWRVIGGNPVINSYDSFCVRCEYKGFKVTRVELHDVCKDPQGNYRDEIIYEIINKEK